ncbi:MAG: nicotinate-nucleotide adenylyltransferase [Eudoraea sp.]|nr:nicotinate-nucleotide adenylyltransferase [Eudoraea sp.]
MKKAGLFFGTFNPIHIGHLIIANYMVEFSDLEEVWFVVTPKSPFKAKKTLLDNNHRYQMVYEAVKDYPKLKASKIEFNLPQPNYTINTLVHLEEAYPGQYHFSLIMGEDNLKNFHKWKNYELILENHDIYVYPRISEDKPAKVLDHPRIYKVPAPIMEISSTFIRRSHKAGKNIRAMLPEGVWQYMDEMNFYRE